MKGNRSLRTLGATLMVVIILVLAPGVQAAHKYKTLYTFTGGTDGGSPFDTLIFDQAGNLYGTTGGAFQVPGPTPGNVFELTPNADGTWTESVLYTFTGGADGGTPVAGLIFDQAGNLYGTTEFGGNLNCSYGCGVVFELTPNGDGTWTESVLYSFTGGKDGRQPCAGLIFDQEGNLYGTTGGGGNSKCNGLFAGCGVAFKLAPNSDGTWTESVLHRFTGGKDGQMPMAGLIFDQAGNLYSTTRGGGQILSYCGDWLAAGCGVAYELTPGSDGSWKEKVLHSFNRQDGMWPMAPPVFDGVGNLYGTAQKGASNACGAESCGTVFELTPESNGKWKRKVLDYFNREDGEAPAFGALIFDTVGNLFGAAQAGGAYGDGVVFKLTLSSGGKWKEHVLHVFRDHPDIYPTGGLIFDAAGNLYGTTQGDGTATFGSVFEITP